MKEIINFPKIKSPFVRKHCGDYYVVTPEIDPDYRWVFEDQGVKAVDKLHGTNICIILENGTLQSVDNRKNRILDSPEFSLNFNAQESRFIKGILNACEKGWIKKNYTGRIYGELVGPLINANIHALSDYFFVPFDYLKEKCHWKSWNKHPNTFQAISDWFKEIPSLFTQRIANLSEYAEGIVFYHPDGRMAKLRRDMFLWYHQG